MTSITRVEQPVGQAAGWMEKGRREQYRAGLRLQCL